MDAWRRPNAAAAAVAAPIDSPFSKGSTRPPRRRRSSITTTPASVAASTAAPYVAGSSGEPTAGARRVRKATSVAWKRRSSMSGLAARLGATLTMTVWGRRRPAGAPAGGCPAGGGDGGPVGVAVNVAA